MPYEMNHPLLKRAAQASGLKFSGPEFHESPDDLFSVLLRRFKGEGQDYEDTDMLDRNERGRVLHEIIKRGFAQSSHDPVMKGVVKDALGREVSKDRKEAVAGAGEIDPLSGVGRGGALSPAGPLGRFPGAELKEPENPSNSQANLDAVVASAGEIDPLSGARMSGGEIGEQEEHISRALPSGEFDSDGEKGGFPWKKLLAIAGGTGLAAAVGGKDFRRGLASGLTQLGPNMARAREVSEQMEFKRKQAAEMKQYRNRMLDLQKQKISATTSSALTKYSLDAQGDVAKHVAGIEEKIVSGEMTPEDGLRSTKTFVSSTPGVKWDGVMADKYKQHFAPHALAVDHFITPAQSADMASATGLQHQAAEIKLRLNNKEVQRHLNLFQSKADEWMNWFASGDPNIVPIPVQRLFQSLGFSMDEIRRMQTGAAANKAEDSFYAELVGAMRLGPDAIASRMDGLISNMQNHRDSPLRQALNMKYEGILPMGLENKMPQFNEQAWVASVAEKARGGDKIAKQMLIDSGLIPPDDL